MLAKTKLQGERISFDALVDLDRSELTNWWIKIYGHPPPKGIKRGLLERAVAYHMQCRPGARLSAARRRQLLQIEQGKPVRRASLASSTLRPGSRLMREWHGTPHEVEVLESGFLWNSQKFRTLSAVARAITGAHWSGPRFFGL